MKKRKVAFVVQRCGEEVNGGAEQLCLTMAKLMAQRWDVTIVTTCALDYMTWKDHYPAGQGDIGGTPVLRFAVDAPRDVERFTGLCGKVLEEMPNTSADTEDKWMRAQGPYSTALFEYLEHNAERFDAFVFFTYLYATTYYGLPLVADRAVLVPAAHDEWPMRMRAWDSFFQWPQRFVFNTPEEQMFVRQRFPFARLQGDVVGVGVSPPERAEPERFRKRFKIPGRFILYLGRLDQSKGVQQLFDNFLAHSATLDASLVLLGKSELEVPKHPAIRWLGFVDETSKWDALAASELLVMPSPYESLSIACLEAWASGKPVLVNGLCPPLVGQCRRSQGGLWYENEAEFAQTLRLLLTDEAIRLRLGRQGQTYVEERYRWPRIENDFARIVEAIWL